MAFLNWMFFKLNIFFTQRTNEIKYIWLAKNLQLIFCIIYFRTLVIASPISEKSLACQLLLKIVHNSRLKGYRFPTKETLLTCFQQPGGTW